MDMAMIGLGRMGGNMALRLAEAGHRISVYDPADGAAAALAAKHANIHAADSLKALAGMLAKPRVFWLMVPHTAVDEVIDQLTEAGLAPDDLVVDGGNSNYKHSQQRGEALAARGIGFVDCGTSGGIWGLSEGYSLMVGGEERFVSRLQPALEALAPGADRGWGHVGPVGAGHFVKMVHNGIEYGMMQSLAEGFELMQHKQEMDLDLHQIARVWQYGSVVRSWLLDLTADALAQDGDLSALSDWMDDSGEGRWTIQESIDLAVPTPVMTLALQMRFRSRERPAFAGKLINAMRAGFGGHAIRPADDEESR